MIFLWWQFFAFFFGVGTETVGAASMDGVAAVMGVVAVKFLGPIEKSTDDDYDASSWLSDFFLPLFCFFFFFLSFKS